MILKIEISERIDDEAPSILAINMVNKNLSYVKNDKIVKNEEISISLNDVKNLLKVYVSDWQKEYVGNSETGDMLSTVSIYTDKEVFTYTFNNAYPDNYLDFKEAFKKMIGLK